MLAEIHRPKAPRDPRTLAMVQCATRHFEQIPAVCGQHYSVLCVSNSVFVSVQIGADRWDFRIFVQICAIQTDI